MRPGASSAAQTTACVVYYGFLSLFFRRATLEPVLALLALLFPLLARVACQKAHTHLALQ